MKLKLSRTYLNTLLAGLVGLLTLVLLLLYLIQASDLFSLDRISAESEAEHSRLAADEASQKAGVLENLNQQQQLQFEAQRATFQNQSLALKKQIADLQQQLQAAKQNQQAAESALDQEQRRVEKLTLELEKNQTELQSQQTVLNSTDASLQALKAQLAEEKRFTKQVRAEHEKDKIRMLEITRELAVKKRELVRNKRQLSNNQQALNARTRELAINTGRQNDQARRHQSLELQLTLLNEEVRILRERIREQEIAATPGNSGGLN